MDFTVYVLYKTDRFESQYHAYSVGIDRRTNLVLADLNGSRYAADAVRARAEEILGAHFKIMEAAVDRDAKVKRRITSDWETTIAIKGIIRYPADHLFPRFQAAMEHHGGGEWQWRWMFDWEPGHWPRWQQTADDGTYDVIIWRADKRREDAVGLIQFLVDSGPQDVPAGWQNWLP